MVVFARNKERDRYYLFAGMLCSRMRAIGGRLACRLRMACENVIMLALWILKQVENIGAYL